MPGRLPGCRPYFTLSLVLTIAQGWLGPGRSRSAEMLSEREREMVTGTDENALVGICFIGPVTVFGSPVCGSGFMLAIEAGTAPATARDQTRSWLCGGKMEAAAG